MPYQGRSSYSLIGTPLFLLPILTFSSSFSCLSSCRSFHLHLTGKRHLWCVILAILFGEHLQKLSSLFHPVLLCRFPIELIPRPIRYQSFLSQIVSVVHYHYLQKIKYASKTLAKSLSTKGARRWQESFKAFVRSIIFGVWAMLLNLNCPNTKQIVFPKYNNNKITIRKNYLFFYSDHSAIAESLCPMFLLLPSSNSILSISRRIAFNSRSNTFFADVMLSTEICKSFAISAFVMMGFRFSKIHISTFSTFSHDTDSKLY